MALMKRKVSESGLNRGVVVDCGFTDVCIMNTKVSESGLNRGVVLDYGFIDMALMKRKFSEKNGLNKNMVLD